MSLTPEQIDEMAKRVDDWSIEDGAIRTWVELLIDDLRKARELLRRVDDHGMWAEISAFLRGGK